MIRKKSHNHQEGEEGGNSLSHSHHHGKPKHNTGKAIMDPTKAKLLDMYFTRQGTKKANVMSDEDILE
jgi:hypothetical protein